MAEFVDQIPQQPGLAFEEKTHQYILNGMQVLPSVTTLMKPLSDTLYAGIRPETLQAAAERGTEVHSAIEDYVTLGITDISEARRGYFEAFLRWMKDYNVQPLSVEHRAYHPALGYAGTLDMLCTLSKSDTDPQVLTLVDFKTSATVNKMLTGVQLEAYEQMLAATGLQVEQKTYRLGRLCYMLAQNREFCDTLLDELDREKVTKIRTAMITKYPENKEVRGIMKLCSRAVDKQQGYKLTYEAPIINTRSEKKTLTEWLRKEKQWQENRVKTTK